MNKFRVLALAVMASISLSFVGCNNTNVSKKVTNSISSESEISIQSIPSNQTEVHFINTGNSDSILIKGEKNILIDGGDNDDEESLVTYIKKEGILKLDYLIATHNHADHIGALDSIVEHLEVSQVLISNGDATTKTYKDFINALADKKLSPSVPLEGAKFDLGGESYMQIFNTNGGKDTNEQSLVTLYVNGNDKFLFTGDSEDDTEHEILSSMMDVDILKIGHHGSRSSTTDDFLDKVNPEFAVITVGADNKYGHPHKAIMEKLKNRDIEVHRTDECEDVIFTSTGNGVKTNCQTGSYNFRD